MIVGVVVVEVVGRVVKRERILASVITKGFGGGGV